MTQTKKKTTAPRQDVWSNIKIDEFFVSDGKVNVVLDNGLFELNDDTGLGKILFSTQTMANNKFSAKLLKVGEDIGEKTLYRWSAFPATALKMRLIGNDIILVTNIVVRNLIIKALDTITYEERTVGSFKGETEKSGSTGTSGSNPYPINVADVKNVIARFGSNDVFLYAPSASTACADSPRHLYQRRDYEEHR